MSEYIGARISLISKSDIRYVGILHAINSDDATVALEQVQSFGTEGRRGGEDEIPPGAATYEYILFRGSDVKDLRIEQPAEKAQPQPPPQVPDDPAILGSARPPQKPQPPAQQQQQTPQQHSSQQPPPFGQYPPYPPGFGRGFPGGPGFPGYPGMPYGAPPPGWFPPPGQGFPSGPPPGSSPFPPQHQPPVGLPGQPQQPQVKVHLPATTDHEKRKEAEPAPGLASAKATQPSSKKAPTPPIETKPDAKATLAASSRHAPAQASSSAPVQTSQASAVPLPPKAKVAIPLPNQKPSGPAAVPTPTPAHLTTASSQQYQDATQAATAAVAAAMAKLPAATKQQASQGDVDNLAKKVQEMRTDDHIRHGRQQGTGGYAAGHRGGRRGGYRGNRDHHQVGKVEIPDTDFDFESANAKFNKQDRVKEAIASGSPVTTPGGEAANGEYVADADANDAAANGEKEEDIVIPPSAQHPAYDRKSSFFDDISSELKEREDSGRQVGGREFRNEERKRNLETFGQGSVDNYRGGYRGRGGRVRGAYRGRGGYRGRGAPKGRGASPTTGVVANAT